MLAKRIIPCLDIRDGQTVKGINFLNVKDVGDPVELGKKYAHEGADELVYLDITATHEKRKLFSDLVSRIARNLNIPFTVGGGINELKDAEKLLSAGADKISVNSSAVRNPDFVEELARGYGSQFVVVAIDAKLEGDTWWVYMNGGRIRTEKDLFSHAREVQERGAGEILFTSMNHDGTKNGFACEAVSKLSLELSIPVIASGGAGELLHFKEVFTVGSADAALAASIFHYNEIPISVLKDYLRTNHITVR
jgi:imidazole glycerol-phosphate synthase subunit HisF